MTDTLSAASAAPGADVAAAADLTFLFTDIEGSTRIEQAVGTPRYAELRERHRAVVRAAIAGCGGDEQETAGDSFFVVFASAGAAISAAAAIVRGLAAEAWPDDAPIRVRIGVHSGRAIEAGGSLVGIDINRAARVSAVAHGDQVLVSAVTAHLAGGLTDGLSLRDLGGHRLKDLLEPVRLYQLAGPDLPETFPPLASLDARPNNLPTQLTSFVGREAELAAACSLLAANRLLTLTGPGGTGKTRLSLQVAAAAIDDHPDGVFFVPLETVRDPAVVASRIAREIGIAESAGRSGRDILVEWLAGKRVLLVLDNFEQVVEAGPLIADILRAAPGLKVVVTSRAALRVSGEHEFPVPGLPVPPDPTLSGGYEQARRGGTGVVDPGLLSTYEAVRLFIARAVAVRPDFAVSNENAPAVAAICARLQGMPLAIELAAARVKLLAPDAILSRLDHQLSVLAAGARDLPARQQTLRGAIAWSYDILTGAERRLLDRLSVFSGGFDLEAAEAIGGPSSDIGLDVLDGLTALADQSLIRVVDGAHTRFQMLETIREFAAEMLDARDDAADIRARHARWFLELAEAAAPRLSGDEQRALLDQLELEHDNIRAALDRAAATADAATAIRLAFAMWRVWQKRGHLNEARRRLEAIAATTWSQDDPLLRARLMEALGGVLWWQADLTAMKVAYREAVEIWRRLGDRAEIANALYNYAFAFSTNPDPKGERTDPDPDGEGARANEEALALYREVGDRRGEANVLWGIGNRAYFQVEGDGGEMNFRRAHELFRAVGDTTMAAWSLHMLGGALDRQDRADEAQPFYHAALRHFHAAGDAAGIALVLDDLARSALVRREFERSTRLRGAARRLTIATGANLAGYSDAFLRAFTPDVVNPLASEAVERLAAEGAALTLDQAVAYALEAPDAPRFDGP
jgi:predicted ATPase/class 3 adenylate cyclase